VSLMEQELGSIRIQGLFWHNFYARN
jgi:hypothetical protein